MGGLSWAVDGADWPNREASQFVTAAGLRWHVQRAGSGPVLLLLHGTGASTHSWRDLLPRLARRFEVIAPDLPGHGFTQALDASRQSLPGVAAAVAELLTHLGIVPRVVVGHSAGAAILVQLCLDGRIDPLRVISLNGAFLPFGGSAFPLLQPLTRLLATSPLTSVLLARRVGRTERVHRLIERTGSKLDERGLELYARVAGDSAHVAGALAMMAGWDLRTLVRDLPRLRQPLALVVGMADGTVKPAEAERVQSLVPQARIVRLWGLGHLAHEERPDQVAEVIGELTREDLATS